MAICCNLWDVGHTGDCPYRLGYSASMEDKANSLLTQYRSHKIVGAFKISQIRLDLKGALLEKSSQRGIKVSDEFMSRCGAFEDNMIQEDADLGYYVRYEDGYESWSPSKAFEEGYTKLDFEPGPVMPGKGDPWAHRSEGMRCGTCMWFVAKQKQIVHKLDSTTEERIFGRCRRHAPTMGGYPAVFGDDWCGDHKLDENKIQV